MAVYYKALFNAHCTNTVNAHSCIGASHKPIQHFSTGAPHLSPAGDEQVQVGVF